MSKDGQENIVLYMCTHKYFVFVINESNFFKRNVSIEEHCKKKEEDDKKEKVE